jgi:hypothetical protein
MTEAFTNVSQYLSGDIAVAASYSDIPSIPITLVG